MAKKIGTMTLKIVGESKKEIKLVKSRIRDYSEKLHLEMEIDRWFYGLTKMQQGDIACNLWKELSFGDKKEAHFEE